MNTPSLLWCSKASGLTNNLRMLICFKQQFLDETDTKCLVMLQTQGVLPSFLLGKVLTTAKLGLKIGDGGPDGCPIATVPCGQADWCVW